MDENEAFDPEKELTPVLDESGGVVGYLQKNGKFHKSLEPGAVNWFGYEPPKDYKPVSKAELIEKLRRARMSTGFKAPERRKVAEWLDRRVELDRGDGTLFFSRAHDPDNFDVFPPNPDGLEAFAFGKLDGSPIASVEACGDALVIITDAGRRFALTGSTTRDFALHDVTGRADPGTPEKDVTPDAVAGSGPGKSGAPAPGPAPSA